MSSRISPPHIPKRPKMLKNAFHSPNFVKISWAILQSFPPTACADSFLEVFLQHSRMEKNSRLFEVYFLNSMVITCESWIPPSPNLDKVAVSFDKLNNHCMIMCMKRTKSKVKIIKWRQFCDFRRIDPVFLFLRIDVFCTLDFDMKTGNKLVTSSGFPLFGFFSKYI